MVKQISVTILTVLVMFVLVGAVKVFSGGIVTDTISELTSAAGVTIDGVLIRDGGITLNQGSIVSKSGVTASTASSVNVNIWTITEYGRYEVVCYLQGVNDAAFYGAFATVIVTGLGNASGLRIVANNTSGMIISLNGANIEVKQLSGNPQQITYRILKI